MHFQATCLTCWQTGVGGRDGITLTSIACGDRAVSRAWCTAVLWQLPWISARRIGWCCSRVAINLIVLAPFLLLPELYLHLQLRSILLLLVGRTLRQQAISDGVLVPLMKDMTVPARTLILPVRRRHTCSFPIILAAPTICLATSLPFVLLPHDIMHV
jgi:hypothetical protein